MYKRKFISAVRYVLCPCKVNTPAQIQDPSYTLW